jgi:predicted nucleic acid-binding protein
MKTTIEISVPLLNQARKLATRQGTTLRALVEEGLRKVVAENRRPDGFRLRQASFKGKGLQPTGRRRRLGSPARDGLRGPRRVIAVDTNLLVYAHREDSPFHQRAAACIAGLAEDRATWAIPWPCLHEFFAIVTHPRIYAPPTPRDAPSTRSMPGSNRLRCCCWPNPNPTGRSCDALISGAQLAGAQVHDARIAALCLQHGVQTSGSADRDFGRFPKLSVTP